ncbi:uncharacterized protein HD556DRAFT_466163 [Suillus plorans]|uniref:Uncharacterized protein n=1 Tax=Suillus plorans TaxID=116603 RepID=A0A9P7AR47_9AGAM|nr:uncharacterized protein HD556DRAFT_466163 [Suillus plorans]KAG1793641.1 hypothetical protein HD556DRAFT_466163 [Suillus plorans]
MLKLISTMSVCNCLYTKLRVYVYLCLALFVSNSQHVNFVALSNAKPLPQSLQLCYAHGQDQANSQKVAWWLSTACQSLWWRQCSTRDRGDGSLP